MKGKIFIAWSGQNTLALEVKKILENEGYSGVVGGEAGAANGLFVGDAVLEEINHSNQAIFVVQKKADGTISNNLMFELGYSLAKFNSKKIHVFYIDINRNDETIPSDLNGIWADHFMSSDTDDIAKAITDRFLSDQKYIIPENKMQVIDNYYRIKEVIQRYHESPIYSEYELAQYVLFFSQAAYLFANETEALDSLKGLSKALHNPGEELSLTISFAMCYIEALLYTQKSDDLLYLKKEDYRTLDRRLRNMEETVASWPEDDFTKWFSALLFDIINYSTVLYASNPELGEERREKYLRESIVYAQKCLDVCDELIKSPANLHFTEIYMAYMYRNMATAQKMLGEDDELIHKNLDDSYKMREKLWDHYNEIKSINSKLLDTFEMEYYLALSEQLEFIENKFRLEDSRDECEEYISRVKAHNREKSHFIHKIEFNINTFGE